MTTHHVVVMVATSYPRFPGDGVGSFMEPIAKGVAARGHEVHLVAPWHPLITRQPIEDGVRFHFFRYAPTANLHVFGYATGLRADTAVRPAAWAMAPVAMLAGYAAARRVAREHHATMMHGHWVIPGGAIAAYAGRHLPLVVSLHGSDVFVAERHPLIGRVARSVFAQADWVTACSDDLHTRALVLGANAASTETVPYGVDTTRFAPDAGRRAAVRSALGLGEGAVVLTAGRLVSKKGFEYLLDAAGQLARSRPALELIIAGEGDLGPALAARARALGLAHVRFAGNQPQSEIARLLAAADVVAVPSIRDDAGNVDGLPNFALEALASGTPVVATTAGGLPQAITDGETGRLVPERDATALAAAIDQVLASPDRGRALGAAARAHAVTAYGWDRAAARFEAAYDRAAASFLSRAGGRASV
jgi:glycosyltransferase involved in cell wall biosynthesis